MLKSKAVSARSNLYKLLKQQPVEMLSTTDTNRYKTHPEDVLKASICTLYPIDMPCANTLAIQKQYGVMCLSGISPDISPLIDVNDIHISKEFEDRAWLGYCFR